MNRRFLSASLIPAFAFLLVTGCGPGPVIWTTAIDCGGDERAVAMAQYGDTLVALGTKTIQGTDHRTWLLQTLTTNGEFLWRREFSQGKNCIPGDIEFDADGSIVAVGTATVEDRTMSIAVKYKANGTVDWQRAIAIGERCVCTGLVLLEDGMMICGRAEEGDRSELFVARLDGEGKTSWIRNYRFGTAAGAGRMTPGKDGQVAVTGQAGTTENPDILVMKLNAKGDTLWSRVYDSGSPDVAGGVVVDVFGNIVATGTAMVDGTPRCVILEYHPDGELIRRAAYGETATAEGNAILASGDGDLLVAGTLTGAGERSALAFHYRPSATSTWERSWREGSDATGVDLTARERDVYLLGTLEQARNGADMVVLKMNRGPVMPAN